MVNLTTTQVEILFEVLEDLDPKLKALGVVKAGSDMRTADGEGV